MLRFAKSFSRKIFFSKSIEVDQYSIPGGLSYDDGIKHIKKEFKKLNKLDRKVCSNFAPDPFKFHFEVYFHETCATDTNQVQVVINSVIDTIIQENLRDTGMI